MTSRLRRAPLHLPFLCALLAAPLAAAPRSVPPPARAAPLAGGPPALPGGTPVGSLSARVPAGDFVLHGTLPVPLQLFARQDCPYRLVDPDGRTLDTQWELVARTESHLVVELRARVKNHWTGTQTFDVVPGRTPFQLQDFLASPLVLTAFRDLVTVRIEDQAGGLHDYSLSGPVRETEFERLGPVTLTGRRHVTTDFGAFQAWFTINSQSRLVELVLNWHAGGLPARPDVHFRSLRLVLPAGWTWQRVLPDPAMDPPPGAGYLVTPDDHVLPQRMERSFRVLLHPDDLHPDPRASAGGFAVGDWSQGGYLAQDIRLPDLSHVKVDLGPRRDDDFARLAGLLPTFSGSQPVSPLWPAAGVRYGGMTGGYDIDQYPAVALAVSGDPAGLESLYVEQLRYASRQMGCIYAAGGGPIELDDYLLPDRSAPWSMFNNQFQGNPPRDAPFFFSKTGPGTGAEAYDPRVFEPIDLQHYVRRTKANKALVWLTNDPLARLYLRMDAELARMTFYEGPGGRLDVPATPGQGTGMGRAEAWAADCLAQAWAIGDDAWRARTAAWFATFHEILRVSQMPNGLFSAVRYGKIAKDPPYGDGNTADYWAHRSDEQVFLILALRAIHSSVGIDSNDLIRTAGRALWDYAWKVGTDGPLQRYPAGPVGGPRYATRADIPAGLTDTVPPGTYHVATVLAHVHEAGREMYGALLAHTGASTVAGALKVFEGWGLDNLDNRANTLALLQEIVGP